MNYTKKWEPVSQIPNLIDSYGGQALPFYVGEMLLMQALSAPNALEIVSNRIVKLTWRSLFLPFLTMADNTFYNFEINGNDVLDIKSVYIINMTPKIHATLISVTARSGGLLNLTYISASGDFNSMPNVKGNVMFYQNSDDEDLTELKKPVINLLSKDRRLNHAIIEF